MCLSRSSSEEITATPVPQTSRTKRIEQQICDKETGNSSDAGHCQRTGSNQEAIYGTDMTSEQSEDKRLKETSSNSSGNNVSDETKISGDQEKKELDAGNLFILIEKLIIIDADNKLN